MDYEGPMQYSVIIGDYNKGYNIWYYNIVIVVNGNEGWYILYIYIVIVVYYLMFNVIMF